MPMLLFFFINALFLSITTLFVFVSVLILFACLYVITIISVVRIKVIIIKNSNSSFFIFYQVI